MASPQRASAPEASYPSMTSQEKILLIRRIAHQTASTAELILFRACCSHDPEFRAYLTDTTIQPVLQLNRHEIGLCLELARHHMKHPDDYGARRMEEVMVEERAKRAARLDREAEAAKAAKAAGEDQLSVPRPSKYGLFRKQGAGHEVRSGVEGGSASGSRAAETGRREDLTSGQVPPVARFEGLTLMTGAASKDQSDARGEGEITPRGTGGTQTVPFSRQATPVRRTGDPDSARGDMSLSVRDQGELTPRGAGPSQRVPIGRQVSSIRRCGVDHPLQRVQGTSPRGTGQGERLQIQGSRRSGAEGSAPRPGQSPSGSRSEIQPAPRPSEIQPSPLRVGTNDQTNTPGQVRYRGGSRSPPTFNQMLVDRSHLTPPTQTSPMKRAGSPNSLSPSTSRLSFQSPFAQAQAQASNSTPSTARPADTFDPFTDPEALICECGVFSCSCFGRQRAFKWTVPADPRKTPASTAAPSPQSSAYQLQEIVVVPASATLEGRGSVKGGGRWGGNGGGSGSGSGDLSVGRGGQNPVYRGVAGEVREGGPRRPPYQPRESGGVGPSQGEVAVKQPGFGLTFEQAAPRIGPPLWKGDAEAGPSWA